MKALAEQDPQTHPVTPTATCHAGEFPVAIPRAHRIEDARSKGAPVDWSTEANPIVISIHPAGISERAAHPAAARIFYNFLASVEGQSLFTEEGFLSSHAGVKPRFPRMTLDNIKHPAPPDQKSASAFRLDHRTSANLPHPGARRINPGKLPIPDYIFQNVRNMKSAICNLNFEPSEDYCTLPSLHNLIG